MFAYRYCSILVGPAASQLLRVKFGPGENLSSFSLFYSVRQRKYQISTIKGLNSSLYIFSVCLEGIFK
jgi:hypothetical protein